MMIPIMIAMFWTHTAQYQAKSLPYRFSIWYFLKLHIFYLGLELQIQKDFTLVSVVADWFLTYFRICRIRPPNYLQVLFCIFCINFACALGILFQSSKSQHVALTSFQNTKAMNENLMICLNVIRVFLRCSSTFHSYFFPFLAFI